MPHSLPKFYACYLLRSLKTGKDCYVGSTPDPWRRLRQHNGLLTQGAKKTVTKRPWQMQMLVHGFPSSSSALQFEWAWQHPHLSRHLKATDVKSVIRNRTQGTLRKNIALVRTMLTTHPFNTWPLHVKLFSDDARGAWHEFNTDMPTGFTLDETESSPEHLEPTDDDFVARLLSKQITTTDCAVCHNPTDTDPLRTALCPANDCTAISHLTCLAQRFSTEHPTATITPRGGSCPSCKQYTLWGDVIRGSYRRQATAGPDSDDLYVPDELSDAPPKPKRGRPPKSSDSTSRLSPPGLASPSPRIRRGRPPKSPVPSSDRGYSSASFDSDIDEEPDLTRALQAMSVRDVDVIVISDED